MPEDITTDLDGLLDILDDRTLETQKSRCQSYLSIKNALDGEGHKSITTIQRLLSACIVDLKDEESIVTNINIVNVIISVLKRLQAGEFPVLPELVSTAVVVVNYLSKIAASVKLESVKLFCFETFTLFPDETLIELALCYTKELIDMLEKYTGSASVVQSRLEANSFTLRVLKTLPPEKRKVFLKNGLKFWFDTMIPGLVSSFCYHKPVRTQSVEMLELLANSLTDIDYADNPYWQNVLENIYTPSKYPNIMKSLLKKGSDSWHLLWIFFIKLLKDQITKTHNSVGSPINSMLPVVEAAFKMGIEDRCRAFQCWNVLIDNFSTETNEVYVAKRIKLLVVPLRSNNAKVEETSIAKFNSWWHLMRSFHSKMDKFSEMTLIPFLHFCFGKHVTSEKSTLVPCISFDSMQIDCIEAFVEIIGHINCENCVKITKLPGRLITTKLLVNHWNDWVYSLKAVVRLSEKMDSKIVTQQITCMWKSFILTIGELPENNIRKDLNNEVLTIVADLLQSCQSTNKLTDMVFNVLILSLFDEDVKMTHVLKADSQNIPIIKVFDIIQRPELYDFYKGSEQKDLLKKFQRITSYILKESIDSSNHIIGMLLKNLPSNENSLNLWTALAESVYESEYDICVKDLHRILLWPLHNINIFTNVEYSASVWYKLYNILYPKLSKTAIENEILHILTLQKVITTSANKFSLYATLAILKNGLASERNCEKEVIQLKNIVSQVDDYSYIENVTPMLIDTIALMLNFVSKDGSTTFAECLISTVAKLVNMIIHVLKTKTDDTNHLLILIEMIFKTIDTLFSNEVYAELRYLIVDELIDASLFFNNSSNKYPDLKSSTLTILKTFLSRSNGSQFYEKIKDTIAIIENNQDKEKPIYNEKKVFSEPVAKESSKKLKKKEPSIVNTTVENGEEYVVVKSNWKFNPRKLTENQKEKFQRKREDIPALYQDLSQSQDEFKLTSWKTDSQDTSTNSTSNSRSTNENISNILKNMSSSDVVPKIMENICQTNDKLIEKETLDIHEPVLAKDKCNISNKSSLVKSLDVKSPRLALKDRVFRNVRNLIENSTLNKEDNELHVNLNQTTSADILKTPPTKPKDSIGLLNSAPSQINVDRPSRVKRTPKKYENSKIFSVKKRQRSASQHDSQPDAEVIDKPKVDLPSPPSPVADILNNKELPPNKENSHISAITDSNETERNDLIQNMDIDSITDKVAQENEVNVSQDVSEELTKEREHSETDIDKPELKEINESAKTNNNDGKMEDKTSTLCIEHISTPKNPLKNKGRDSQKSSVSKSSSKKSRIEKELSIDMVEGNPFLKSQPEKRTRRKVLVNTPNTGKRKSFKEKNSKNSDQKSTPRTEKKLEVDNVSSELTNEPLIVAVSETQELCSNSETFPLSEDIIESSQDSTITTISVTSKRNRKMPLVVLNRSETQNLLENTDCMNDKPASITQVLQESKEDIDLPQNKTAYEDDTRVDVTADMDTQPIEKPNSSDVIVINDDEEPIVINSEDSCIVPDTQDTENADTQPINPAMFTEPESQSVIQSDKANRACKIDHEDKNITDMNLEDTQNTTKTITPSDLSPVEKENENLNLSSPFKDEVQRKKDFLNNTFEISPIKTLSPVREKKSPSPETSSDYVVIKLTSPVQSNGEPFEKCDSPEIFTEDKVSPDKRDQSPPREEVSVTANTSPSSSLSLKKNRPQVRTSGRAAQMLGLCVPDKLQNVKLSEKVVESEEPKKNTLLNTPARRNLRMLYTTVGENDSHDEKEDSEQFLKFKRSLPTAESSPSGPILKRKLAEIVDEATISPASKKKRVSFHDPPVSTTMSVQKYIEPSGIRSPQSSGLKRQERQQRMHAIKSPKRLDTVFKLDNALIKTVESFESDANISLPSTTETQDSEMSSLDQTPVVEIVKTSELNDNNPICPELVDCKDTIDVIASELSSPAMKASFVKMLEGKIETIGDLAKMTELGINRLCIKAPKVQVAKKALEKYMRNTIVQNKVDETPMEEVIVPDIKSVNIETQTNSVKSIDIDMQTNDPDVTIASTQTDERIVTHSGMQTEESGYTSTEDIISRCLKERLDFAERLGEQLDETSVHTIIGNISNDIRSDVVMQNVNTSNSESILNRILQLQGDQNEQNKDKELIFLENYLCSRFDSNDVILLCSRLLKNIHKPK